MKRKLFFLAAFLTATVMNLSAATAGTAPDMHDFLYFVGLNGNDTVRLNKYATTDVNLSSLTATFEYSTDRKNWTEYTWGTYGDPVTKTALGAAIELAQGDTVFFRAKGQDGFNGIVSHKNTAYLIFAFGVDDSIAAGGNVMSLYDATCEQDKMTIYGFYKLFNGAKQLVSAPKLPATKLEETCYSNMFYGCTSLTTAHALPATTLTKDCYSNMFSGCTALTQAPELKATALESRCCEYMFQGCSSLTTAPALPASTLKNSCYSYMFSGCTALTKAPELKATALESRCYEYMFQGCGSLQVDTCDGSCDGVMFEPTTIGDEPSSWNKDMFKGCKGDAVGNIQLGGHYCIKEYVPQPDMHDFLYFVGLNGNDTVRLNKMAIPASTMTKLTATFEYSKDRKTWTEYTWNGTQGDTIALPNANDTVFFRAKGTDGKNATLSVGSSTLFQFAFGADDSIAAGGNTMSLYDATCKQDTMTTYGFYALFQNATQLVSAPKLPATKLAGNCYYSMFRYCISLTKAPELRATTLAEKCYYGMFYSCTNLEIDTCLNDAQCEGALLVVPTVSGTAPSNWNQDMFKGCKGEAQYTATFGIQLGGHYCIKEYVPQPDMHDFLYFVGLNGNDTVRLNKVGKDYADLTATFEYSKDRIYWTAYDTWGTYGDPVAETALGAAIALNQGDTIFFRAKGVNGKNNEVSLGNASYFIFAFGVDDSIAAGGNTMSLYDATCERDAMFSYGFYMLFNGAKQLLTAPKLPATELAPSCYVRMFQGSGLTTAPALPATTLATQCYVDMFRDCASLIQALAVLPATTLEDKCYNSMFRNCTALTTAPALQATTLAFSCYNAMFQGCTSLLVDTCADGSCDGAELVVPSTGAKDWNKNMFKDCKGAYADNIQLNGHYCIKEYVPVSITAEFDMQGHGEQVEPQTIASGSKFKKPADPTATGVDFDGWFWDAAGDSAFDFNQAVKSTSDTTITIYAKWVRRDYLHFVGLNGNDTVQLNRYAATSGTLGKLTATFEYSKDRKSWDECTWGAYEGYRTMGNIITLNQGDTVFFRAKGVSGKNATLSVSGNYFYFSFGADDSIAVGGNPMSLYDAECKQDTMTKYGFNSLFRGAKQLMSAPKLPATQLNDYCYSNMFTQCSSLKEAPELPVMDLDTACYISMFHGCKALTKAPELPATNLAYYCYNDMFFGCASLTQAPELKATTLAEYCYALMFSNCTKLQVDTLLGSCSGAELVVPDTAAAPRDWNKNMFNGCHEYATTQLGGHYCISEWKGPRALKFQSMDSTRTYDATPLVADSIIIEGDRFDRSLVTFDVTGSQTNVGESENTFTYTWKNAAQAQDYTVDTVYGKLKVDFINTSNDPIRVKIEDITHLYDGQTVHATYTVTGGLTAGDSVAVVMDTTELTDAGLIPVKAISQKIYRGETDVTAGYIMAAIENGSIQINPREVRLTSGSAEKIYDGTPLTNDTVDISLDGFAPGEGIESFDVTGTRTQVGVSNNKFTYILQSNTKATNYTIEKVEGTLTIKSPVTAQIDSLYENWNLVFHKNKMIADFLLVDATIQVEIEPEDVHWYIMNGDQDEFDPATGLPKGDDVAANPATGFFHTEDKAMTGAYYVIVKVEEAKAKMGVEYFTSNVLKLEAPKAPVRNNAKFIQNGQLIIESNGAQYNAQGMKL